MRLVFTYYNLFCACGSYQRINVAEFSLRRLMLTNTYLPASFPCRCICPHGTSGARCKVLRRHFEGSGGSSAEGAWAWVPPIPTCAEVHVSLEVLSTAEEAALLYSGTEKQGQGEGPNDLLLLELRQGRPVLLLNLGGGPVTVALNSCVADDTWHRIDIIWKDEVRRGPHPCVRVIYQSQVT